MKKGGPTKIGRRSRKQAELNYKRHLQAYADAALDLFDESMIRTIERHIRLHRNMSKKHDGR